MNLILIYFSIKYQGDWDAIYKALEEKEKVALQEIKNLEEQLKADQVKVKTILDIDYPHKLKEAYKPPFCVFYEGNIDVLNDKFISFTGTTETKEVSNQTQSRIDKFFKDSNKAIALVRSISRDDSKDTVDRAVAKATNEHNKLLLLSRGLTPEDKQIAGEKTLIMTEYPAMTEWKVSNSRNTSRIEASFAESLVLVESLKGKASINDMVASFLNVGKDINCFPGDGSEKDGNSELIKQGASLITNYKDIAQSNSKLSLG